MPKIIGIYLKRLRLHRRSILLTAVSLIAGLLLFFSVFSYVNYRELARVIFRFSLWKFIIFLIISSFVLIITAIRWRLILSAKGYNIPFGRLFKYRLAGFGFSYLTPIAELGGAPFRAYLLESQGIPFERGLLTVIIDNFIQVLTEGFLVTLGILAFLSHFGFSHRLEWLLAVSAIFFLVLIIWLFIRLRRGEFLLIPVLKIFQKKRFFKTISHFERCFVEFFDQHRTLAIKAFLLSLVSFIGSVVEIGFLLYLMGYSLGILDIFLAKVILNIATLFPVPAALGVSEWAQASFFSTTMAGKSTGFAFSILMKAKNLFYSFVGIGLFIYWWHKRVRLDKHLISYLSQKIHAKSSKS